MSESLIDLQLTVVEEVDGKEQTGLVDEAGREVMEEPREDLFDLPQIEYPEDK